MKLSTFATLRDENTGFKHEKTHLEKRINGQNLEHLFGFLCRQNKAVLLLNLCYNDIFAKPQMFLRGQKREKGVSNG